MADPMLDQGETGALDKKAQKKAEKARKKEEKMNRSQVQEETPEEQESGGKLAVALASIIFIIIWLAILALVIKMDIGGFGSTVLQPILKDVPYINKILPETVHKETAADRSEEHTSELQSPS